MHCALGVSTRYGTAAGPGGLGETIRFLVSDDPAGRIRDVVEILASVLAIKLYLEQRTHKPVAVSDGLAVLLGAHAIMVATGKEDLEYQSSAPIWPAGPDDGYRPDGWLIVFRDPEAIYEVIVGKHGGVQFKGHTSLDLEVPAAKSPWRGSELDA